MIADRVAVLDWSAAGRPVVGSNAIWLGIAGPDGVSAQNLPTRHQAEARLRALVTETLAAGERLLLGADFAFGYPPGFARALTGTSAALAVWHWLEQHIEDHPDNSHNLRHVAAAINARFAGGGPFWGNGARAEVPGLPRRRPPLPPGLTAHRPADIAARSSGGTPKSVWQLAGAGAVGAQSLTGLPVLERLRRAFPKTLAVWPFQPADTSVVVAEVYPSMLSAEVRAAEAAEGAGACRDRVQVTLLASALLRLSQAGTLGEMLHDRRAGEDGQILGAGHVATLRAALAD